jgi:hypothetical protein
MDTWIQIGLALLALAGIVGFLSYALGTALEELFKQKRISKFEEDFKSAVNHSQPTWDEMKEIARTRWLSQKDVQHIYRRTMREILTGENETLSSHKELIRSYIERHNEEEPFEGIPNEIRIHLERLREKTDGQKDLLDPLTNQIKDLLSINEKEKKQQKYYTMGGFFIGLIGFGFAVYAYFWAPSAGSTVESNQQIEKTR